jgi:hypothetical protein
MESNEQPATDSSDQPAKASPVEQPATNLVTTPTIQSKVKEDSSSPESSDFSTDTSRSSPEPSPFYLPQAWTYSAWTDTPFVSPPRQPMRPSAQPRRLAARAPVPRIQIFGDVALVDGEYEEILLRPSLMVDAEEYDRQARAFLAQQRRLYPDKRLPKVPIHPHAHRRRAAPEPSMEDGEGKSRDDQSDGQDEGSTSASESTARPSPPNTTIPSQVSPMEAEDQPPQSSNVVTQSHDVASADQRDVELTREDSP